MISYPWTVGWEAQGQDIDEFPYFKRWFEELGARPARAARHGRRLRLGAGHLEAHAEEQERLRKLLYNQRARPAPPGGLL